jgi:hypothetical protein
VHEAERGEREALDHDLHAQVGHVPAAVVDDVVEQQPEVGVERVVPVELGVEVLGEHLDVAGLVHHLGRGVVLGVDPRHRLDDLRRADQRTLLAVHELAEGPVVGLDAEVDPLLLAPLLERACRPRRSGEALPVGAVLHEVVDEHLLDVDLGVPGRSVSPFHCETLAFSYSLSSGRRAPFS